MGYPLERSERDYGDSPFFSIGVTTYDRVSMLVETLSTILEQTFDDFEVIVGNDNPDRVLSGESLGICDRRIRFVNHRENLGELDNMNSLVRISRGRYFTWIADDDLYDPHFLENIHRALVSFDYPACAFASYEVFSGMMFPKRCVVSISEGELLAGSEFLRRYLNGEIKTIGTMGAFDRTCLQNIGGLEDLSGENIAILSEYMLILKAGTCKRVCYINAPLTYYREHGESWGIRNTDLEIYKRTGRKLLSQSKDVLQKPSLCGDFRQNIFGVFRISLSYVFGTATKQPRHFLFWNLFSYYLSLREEFSSLKKNGLYVSAVISWLKAGLWLLWSIVKFKLKNTMPAPIIRIALNVRSFLGGWQ